MHSIIPWYDTHFPLDRCRVLLLTPEPSNLFANPARSSAFYLRVQRSPEGSPRTLQINPQQAFPVEGLDYYAWFYEGSQFWTYVGGVGMVRLSPPAQILRRRTEARSPLRAQVIIMLAGVMFPLWPYTLRLGVWYLSMGVLGLLGAFFAMAILRLIFYVITLVVASPGIWVFPRLFEDVSFVRPPPFRSTPSGRLPLTRRKLARHLPGRLVDPSLGLGRPRQEGQEGKEDGREGLEKGEDLVRRLICARVCGWQRRGARSAGQGWRLPHRGDRRRRRVRNVGGAVVDAKWRARRQPPLSL